MQIAFRLRGEPWYVMKRGDIIFIIFNLGANQWLISVFKNMLKFWWNIPRELSPATVFYWKALQLPSRCSVSCIFKFWKKAATRI